MTFLMTGFECGGEPVLAIIKFIIAILDIILFLVPMFLIVILTIDFGKAVIAADEEKMNKCKSIALKRVILCIILLCIKPITRVVIGIAGDNNLAYVSCLDIALKEDISKYKIEYTYTTTKKNIDLSDRKKKVAKVDKSKSNSVTGKFEIKDKKNLVGIFYSTTFDVLRGSNPKIISDGNCNLNEFCYWGKPALGFYKSSDKKVIRKHMEQLADAGVDFIIIDNTNAHPDWIPTGWKGYITKPETAILDTIVAMRKEGKKTPYVVNWMWTGQRSDGYDYLPYGSVPFLSWEIVNYIYEEFYTKKKYEEAWVYWNGKPFILTTSTPTSSSSKKITTRSLWGGQGTGGVNWSYLETNNDKPGRDSNGNVEQIGVSIAVQSTYMSTTSTALGRRGGRTFYEQWTTAFKYHPKVVTITWWNEWGAINLNGNYSDEYNQEYSRDIEPMSGGHGDKYYKWMKKYIKAYKENKSCPKLVD